MARAALVALISGVAIAAGSAAAAAQPSSPTWKRLVIVGGTPAQRQLALLTAERVGGLTLRRVIFQPASAFLRHAGAHGTELVVSSAGNRTLRAIWEQELFIGVYLGLVARHPDARIGAAAASDGTQAPIRRLRAYDVFSSNPKAVEVGVEIRDLIQQAGRTGAKVIELRVAATPERLIALTLRVPDPAAFLKDHTKPFLDLLAKPRIPLLGYYLAVQNGNGQIVWATSRLPDVGSVFVIPALDACSPVDHSEPAASQPPPCPAH